MICGLFVLCDVSKKRTVKLVGSAAMASVFSTFGALARFVFQLIPIQLHGNVWKKKKRKKKKRKEKKRRLTLNDTQKYFRMASNFSLYYQNQSLADVRDLFLLPNDSLF